MTNYFAFLNYISFQLDPRAYERDLLGVQSLQLTFINTAPSKYAPPHDSQASRITHALS